MNCLFIDTMPEGDARTEELSAALCAQGHKVTYMATRDMDIKPCIGCNACWLKTPGVCAIKDDHEKLLITILQADRTVFFADTRLGFVSHEMKDVIDRILPLATMYLHFKDGQMRHISRYGKGLDAGLVYRGEADGAFLSRWMERVTLNMDGRSLGAFKIEEKEAAIHAFTDR